jgi:hypothetical protein
MKRYLFFGLLIFFIVVGSAPVWSSGEVEKDPQEQETEYYIRHPHKDRIQVLGGQSTNAANGLERARTRARFMGGGIPDTKPKDDAEDDTDETVQKKKKK